MGECRRLLGSLTSQQTRIRHHAIIFIGLRIYRTSSPPLKGSTACPKGVISTQNMRMWGLFQIQAMAPLKRNCGRCSLFLLHFIRLTTGLLRSSLKLNRSGHTVIRVQGVEPNWLLLIFFSRPSWQPCSLLFSQCTAEEQGFRMLANLLSVYSCKLHS